MTAADLRVRARSAVPEPASRPLSASELPWCGFDGLIRRAWARVGSVAERFAGYSAAQHTRFAGAARDNTPVRSFERDTGGLRGDIVTHGGFAQALAYEGRAGAVSTAVSSDLGESGLSACLPNGPRYGRHGRG